MAGVGLMNLVAYGAQDVYLSGTPQQTYFRTTYRQYTNFGMGGLGGVQITCKNLELCEFLKKTIENNDYVLKLEQTQITKYFTGLIEFYLKRQCVKCLDKIYVGIELLMNHYVGKPIKSNELFKTIVQSNNKRLMEILVKSPIFRIYKKNDAFLYTIIDPYYLRMLEKKGCVFKKRHYEICFNKYIRQKINQGYQGYRGYFHPNTTTQIKYFLQKGLRINTKIMKHNILPIHLKKLITEYGYQLQKRDRPTVQYHFSHFNLRHIKLLLAFYPDTNYIYQTHYKNIKKEYDEFNKSKNMLKSIFRNFINSTITEFTLNVQIFSKQFLQVLLNLKYRFECSFGMKMSVKNNKTVICFEKTKNLINMNIFMSKYDADLQDSVSERIYQYMTFDFKKMFMKKQICKYLMVNKITYHMADLIMNQYILSSSWLNV